MLNFLSCQMIMDSPIFLFAESLDANATVMGLIAGMTPLMVVFQIPAAAHVGRGGYRRFIVIGWTVRLIFVAGLVFVPLLSDVLNPPNQLALVLALLFGFNLIRGISSCAWFPWIRGLIPEGIRGRYLTWETASANVGSLGALLLAALYLGGSAEPHRFAVLFLFSLVVGLASLVFLRRTPDVSPPKEEAGRQSPAPWGEMLRHRAFRKLLRVNFAGAVLSGGMAAFLVKFLRGPGGLPDDAIMFSASAKFVGAMATIWFLHARLDRIGSRPVIFLALFFFAGILLTWFAVAGGVLSSGLPLAIGLHFTIGFAAAMFTMAMTRLAMATVPRLASSHYFALYSVVGSVTLGVFPILWGLLIDSLQPVHIFWMGIEWNQFSIYFAAVFVVLLFMAGFVRRIEETKAARVEDLLLDLVRNSPLRYWFRD